MTTAEEARSTITLVNKSMVWIDRVVAVILSAYGVILVSGLVHNDREHSGALAAVMVLLMTSPVAWRRKAPVAVAAVLAAGAILNPLVVGDMIRCGPALPALLLCSYAIGRKPERLSRQAAWAGLSLLLAAATVQCFTDPQLNAGVMVAMAPLILGLYGAGLAVRSHSQMAAELEQRNSDLRRQKQRRAELAVQADRARIAEGLDASLNAQISGMSAAATTGRCALQTAEATNTAQEAFAAIQDQGRQTLGHMRRMVGTMLQPGTQPKAPQPSLSQLDRLVTRSAPGVDVRLHVTGAPTTLPAGLEVSAYRTLEHLLDAFGDGSGSSIDVGVDFAAEALSLRVSGPTPPAVDRQAALASAQARVDVHHGFMSSSFPGNRWETSVTLPLDDRA